MSERFTTQTFVDALIEHGIIPANSAPLSQREDRPWFVAALQGLAGWMAGIFVLIFVGTLFEPKTAAAYTVLAVPLLAAAFVLYAANRDSVFLDQLALAASIAGQIAATIALAEAANSASLTAAYVAMMQCLLVIILPNHLARALSAFFACIAWALAVRFAWWGEHESWNVARHAVALGPALIGWAVIWIPVAALCTAAVAGEDKWMGRAATRIVRPALSGMLLALTVGTFASIPFDAFAWLGSSGSPPQSWIVLWPLLNALASLLAGFAAFRLRNKALLGIAIAAALLHVGHFYFLLGTTLVVKSIVMVTVGALLLGWALLLNRGGISQDRPAI